MDKRVYHCLFIYLLLDGILGCFLLLVTMNNAFYKHSHASIYFLCMNIFLGGYRARSRMARSGGNFMFNHLRNCQSSKADTTIPFLP